LPDLQIITDPANGLLAPPAIAVAVNGKQIVGRGRVTAMRQRRRRRHADRGDGAIGPVDPIRRMNVVMAVQDEVVAVPLQQRA
jgi:hypothetical protein